MNILFMGDIVGGPGRRCIHRWLGELREEFAVDVAVANAENAAGGLGATPEILRELFAAGVDGITLGNHTWRKRELVSGIDQIDRVVRPANYPPGVPGRGAILVPLRDGRRLGLINVLGRVYMEPFDCPFTVALEAVERLSQDTPFILVDMHAEATAEKIALGWYLDGHCTAVVGTHTHVQTADERVLPKGTAYITDVGMTGPHDSVIGTDRDTIIKKFLTGLPAKFNVAEGRPGLHGVVIEADDQTGLARAIRRIARFDG